MRFQLAISSLPWQRQRPELWGVDCDCGEWVLLSEVQAQTWYLQPLSWVTPWGALLVLYAAPRQRRWLWIRRQAVGDAQYRRLARFLLRWRQDGWLRF